MEQFTGWPVSGNNGCPVPEQLLESVPGQRVPRDGVRDGGEDPVEFTKHCSAVSKLSWNQAIVEA